ncbi:MAG: serine--tRNA ligase [Candidatus Peribacteria bacterium]|nr:serine--tRNA ligase [Candidatus Peribacteria bacterium]
MIDLQDLRARPETYQKAADDKRIRISIADFLTIDEKRKTLLQRVEEMRARKNKVSKDVPTLKGDEKDAAIKDMKELGETLKKDEEELTQLEAEWQMMQLRIPGIPLPNVPVGKDDSENAEVRTWGTVPSFDFELKDHVTLGEELDIIDIPRGVKVSGTRFYFLKGDGARLEQAIMQFTLDMLHRKGFTQLNPPVLSNWDMMMGTSYFPGGEESAYAVGVRREKSGEIEPANLYLIGTAEVPVTSYHAGELLDIADLPRRYAGYSNGFRGEAGTYGKDTRGLYRVHQIQKVEQVILCENSPEVSAKMHEEILGNAEEVLQVLQLPYRVVDVCTGDMGQGQIYKNDIETWMPSRNGYGETHSCSTFHEFQSRRLNIKYVDRDGSKKFVHTLNNTCIASPRILIPILEMYQNADGTVTVPEVLRPYMGGQEKITRA